MSDKYIVWRRNDGYIAATANHMPQNWLTGGSDPGPGETHRPGSGVPVTFEFLAEFPEWTKECYDFIVDARAKEEANRSIKVFDEVLPGDAPLKEIS
jgi:hypothetical protein